VNSRAALASLARQGYEQHLELRAYAAVKARRAHVTQEVDSRRGRTRDLFATAMSGIPGQHDEAVVLIPAAKAMPDFTTPPVRGERPFTSVRRARRRACGEPARDRARTGPEQRRENAGARRGRVRKTMSSSRTRAWPPKLAARTVRGRGPSSVVSRPDTLKLRGPGLSVESIATSYGSSAGKAAGRGRLHQSRSEPPRRCGGGREPLAQLTSRWDPLARRSPLTSERLYARASLLLGEKGFTCRHDHRGSPESAMPHFG